MVADEAGGSRLIMETLSSLGIGVEKIEPIRPSLEDVFLHVLHDVPPAAGGGG